MCGICGIFNLSGDAASPQILQRMSDAIAHRGPDGEGAYIDGAVGFGHRRLAIIDLSPSGRQPMMTHDGRYLITYNGELYNYRELRTELETHAHQFRTRTDTEVVLAALSEWGTDALIRFNGMFAFALWDKHDKSMLLARDRFGVKPLYYAERDRVLTFGSEIKAILKHPAFSAQLDKAALLEYMTFQNLFTDRTLFDGVKLLPAGSFIKIKHDSTSIPSPQTYWDYRFTKPNTTRAHSEAEYLEELDHLFRQAVKRQLMSDVPVGSYLSGGMDSGSITAIAAKELPHLTTFTCGFDLMSASGLELNFDERARAEHMSYLFQTEHYEMVLKAGDMERAMSSVVHHLEEPRVGQSYPNYLVSRLASKFCKVVLSGTGGDELFGGYPWRYYRATSNDNFEDYVDKYYKYWQRLLDNRYMPLVFEPIWGDVKHVWTRDIFRDVFKSKVASLNTPEEYVNHSLYFELKTFLHGLLLVEDKLGMAHGLEARVPFLDNDLVDFALRLPVNFKLANITEVSRINENVPGKKTEMYFARNRDGKLLLRKMMERYIPREVTEREKQGFSAPDASWFRGESIEYVKRTLFRPDARLYEVMAPEVVQNLVGEHLAGKENRRLLVWSLLYLEHWFKEFLPR